MIPFGPANCPPRFRESNRLRSLRSKEYFPHADNMTTYLNAVAHHYGVDKKTMYDTEVKRVSRLGEGFKLELGRLPMRATRAPHRPRLMRKPATPQAHARAHGFGRQRWTLERLCRSARRSRVHRHAFAAAGRDWLGAIAISAGGANGKPTLECAKLIMATGFRCGLT